MGPLARGGEIGLMIGASVAGLPLPLSAVQTLYVNFATDGLPALALAVDPPERDLMQRPPRDSRSDILNPCSEPFGDLCSDPIELC